MLIPYSIYGNLWRTLPGLTAIAISMGLCSTASADVFRYKDGRLISGKVIDESKQTVDGVQQIVWAVEIQPGVLIQVLDSELAYNGREPLSDARQQYASNVVGMEETAENHLQVAGWCSKHGLNDLAQAHFLRVLDLEPDNRRARIATGYIEDANGRWVKQDQVMGEVRGKVQWQGRWRFPESVKIEREKEAAKQRLAEATRDLARWHLAAKSAQGTRYNEAINGLQQIDNPLAIGTIADYLLDTRKPTPDPLKLLYVRVLARFNEPAAAAALAQASVVDPSHQIRIACLDALARYGREVAIPIYVGYLQHKNNLWINNAADGIGKLQGETAIFPLIHALVTKHSQTVGSDATNASPTSGQFSMGSKKTVNVSVKNQSVLGTLAQLSGQNFGFDHERWLAWYASRFAASAIDLRRDY